MIGYSGTTCGGGGGREDARPPFSSPPLPPPTPPQPAYHSFTTVSVNLKTEHHVAICSNSRWVEETAYKIADVSRKVAASGHRWLSLTLPNSQIYHSYLFPGDRPEVTGMAGTVEHDGCSAIPNHDHRGAQPVQIEMIIRSGGREDRVDLGKLNSLQNRYKSRVTGGASSFAKHTRLRSHTHTRTR